MTRAVLPAIGFLATLAFACVPEFNDDLSLVRAPRVVAIRTTPAEAKETKPLTFDAVVVAPLNASSSPPEFRLCLDRKPLTELGSVSPRCLHTKETDPEIVKPLGSSESVMTTMPADACRLFGPRRPDPKPGEPSGRPVDPDPTGGFYQPVLAWLDPEHKLLGAARIDCGLSGAAQAQQREFTSRYRPNENPELSAFELEREDGSRESLLEGESRVLARSEHVKLWATWPSCPRSSVCGDNVCSALEDATNCTDDCRTPRGCTGAETYAFYDRENASVIDRRESIVLAWYTTDGRFSSERSGRTEDEPDGVDTSVDFYAPTTPGPLRLWAVISDNRGGVGYRSVDLDVAAP